MDQVKSIRTVSAVQQLAEVRRRISADHNRLAPFVFRCPRHHADAQEGLGPIVDRLSDNSRAVRECPACRQPYLLEVADGIPVMLGLTPDAAPQRE